MESVFSADMNSSSANEIDTTGIAADANNRRVRGPRRRPRIPGSGTQRRHCSIYSARQVAHLTQGARPARKISNRLTETGATTYQSHHATRAQSRRVLPSVAAAGGDRDHPGQPLPIRSQRKYLSSRTCPIQHTRDTGRFTHGRPASHGNRAAPSRRWSRRIPAGLRGAKLRCRGSRIAVRNPSPANQAASRS